VLPPRTRPAARQVIEAGEAVVSIPQELALQLGTDGVNPGYAAANLCKIELSEERRAAGWFQPFLDVLPTREQCDTTDFFSEEELAALEWDPVLDETRERLKMLRSTYEASQIAGVNNEHQPFSWDEFLWGVYQVVSRVLTIYTDSEGGQKYLIPVRITVIRECTCKFMACMLLIECGMFFCGPCSLLDGTCISCALHIAFLS